MMQQVEHIQNTREGKEHLSLLSNQNYAAYFNIMHIYMVLM